MGMYTGVRCKVIIKPEYREELNRLFTNNLNWKDSEFAIFKIYSQYSRADFIPYGSLSYMPDEWEDKNENATDGFDRQFNVETGYWAFQCSLKNYDSTIEYFFDNVLTEIVESIIHLERLYEEWSSSLGYQLIDNKIIVNNKKFVKYSNDDDYY